MLEMIDEYEKDTLFQIPNLSFDHPLNYFEKQQLKDIIFYVVSLKQISFKEGTNADTIKFLKYLLEASTHLEDGNIEKYIYDPKIAKQMINEHFDHPDTWQVVYQEANGKKQLFSMSDYRSFDAYFETILEEIKRRNLSEIEKILYCYDRVKLFSYSDDNHKNLLEVISKKTASIEEFQWILKELLDRLQIPSYVGKVATKTGISYITMVQVKDEKYHLDGYYLFDPSSDCLPEEKYKSKLVRQLNYNFFALHFEEIEELKTGDFLKDILGVFSLTNKDLAKARYEMIKDKFSKKEWHLFESTFSKDFDKLYEKIHQTSFLSIDILKQIITGVYKKEELEEKQFSFLEALEQNYHLRRNELFSYKEEIEELKYLKKQH